MRRYENRVPATVCPHCGAQRPHDWFTASSDACWRCRSANPALARNKVAAEKGASKRAALKRARRNGEKL